MAIAACRTAAVAIAACLVIAACGDDDSDSGVAVDIPPPGGIHEGFLADNPTASLDLTHTVVLFLESAGEHAGDTGEDSGVDELRYFFDSDTELTLNLADDLASAADAPTLVLRDDRGGEIARVDDQNPARTVHLSGAHTLELRHPRAGATDAEPQVLFLRPVAAAAGDAETSGSDAVAILEASQDCIACDLRGVDLDGSFGLVFQDIKLDLADFTGATITGVGFSRTQLIGAIFDDAVLEELLFINPVLTAARFENATFPKDPADTCEGRSCRSAPDDPNCCFRNCRTSFLIFEEGSLTGAMDKMDLSGAELNAVCLTGAVLTETKFVGTVFDDASTLHGSVLTGADVGGLQLLGTDLIGYGPFGESPGSDTLPASFIGVTQSGEGTGIVFDSVDLRGVEFEVADLRNCSFSSSLMDESTTFFQADLSGADFAGVNLSRVDLSVAFLSPGTSFAGATLSDGSSRGVNLACVLPIATGGCEFEEGTTDFKGANLSFANLSGVDLAAADLEGAILDNATLISANLNLASLKDASLRGVLMGVAPGSSTPVAQLGRAYMVNVDLTDADLRGANLSGAHLYGDSLLVRTALDSADFTGAICVGAAFSGSLNDTVFNQAVLVNAAFNGATLTNAKFDSAYLQGADFSAATVITGVTLRNAAVSTAEGNWMFTEQDGTPYTFVYDPTLLGALATNGTVVCPNDQNGPCTGAKLIPVANGPLPPKPDCIPSAAYCFENCLDPQNFDNTPPCR